MEARIDADFIFRLLKGTTLLSHGKPTASPTMPCIRCSMLDVEPLARESFRSWTFASNCQSPYLDEKRLSSWRVRSGLVRCIAINQSHAHAHHRSPRWNGSGSLQRRENLARHPCRLGRRRNTERSLLRRRLVRSADVSPSEPRTRSRQETSGSVSKPKLSF